VVSGGLWEPRGTVPPWEATILGKAYLRAARSKVGTTVHAEADLGMFSMFGRTGALQEDRQIFAT